MIKRMLGEYVMSRYILTQNRETMYRMIAYNCYRMNRDVLEILMVSTGPKIVVISGIEWSINSDLQTKSW